MRVRLSRRFRFPWGLFGRPFLVVWFGWCARRLQTKGLWFQPPFRPVVGNACDRMCLVTLRDGSGGRVTSPPPGLCVARAALTSGSSAVCWALFFPFWIGGLLDQGSTRGIVRQGKWAPGAVWAWKPAAQAPAAGPFGKRRRRWRGLHAGGGDHCSTLVDRQAAHGIGPTIERGG